MRKKSKITHFAYTHTHTNGGCGRFELTLYEEELCADQWFSILILATDRSAHFVSLLSNTPGSEHQLIRRELQELN